MLYLLLCWLILLVGVGASALLSQQIIVDSNSKYNKYLVKLNEETEKKWKKKKEQWEKDKEIEKEKRKEKEIKEHKEKEELALIKENQTENEEKKEDQKENEELLIKEEDSKESEIKETKTEKEKEINLKQKKDDKDSEAFKNIFDNIQEVETKPKNLRKAKTLYLGEPKNGKEKEKDKKIKSKKSVKSDEKESKGKNKFDSFFMICLTTIIGYFIKYFFNLIITERNDNKKNEYMDLVGCSNDTSCYDNFIKENNFTINNTLNDKLKKIIYDNENKSFYIIIIIYASCIVVSIILYSIFVCIFTKNEKKENADGNKYRVCEICGYTIYSEDIILNQNPPCCECCKLFCNTTKDCLYMAGFSLNNVIDFCGIGEDCNKCCKKSKDKENQDDEEKEDEEEDEKNKKQYCCCYECSDYKKEEYKKNKEFFCYCYQAKRKQTWFNKFLTSDIQKKILPYMVEFFFLQLLTIAFEKQYLSFSTNNETEPSSNENNNHTNSSYFLENYLFYFNSNETNNDTDTKENNNSILKIDDLYTFLTFVVTFFLFFYFTLAFNNIYNFDAEEKEEKKEKKR